MRDSTRLPPGHPPSSSQRSPVALRRPLAPRFGLLLEDALAADPHERVEPSGHPPRVRDPPAKRTGATVKPARAPTGPTQTATVIRIVDGDTIVVSIEGKDFKLRYIGMDTPEDVDPNSPVEPMSREAAAANQKLVAGKTVLLEKDVSETDRYGRLLRYVWLHQGSTWTLVNLELVRLGFASAESYP